MPAPARSTSPPPLAVTRKYQLIRELGAGAYGVVSSAKRLDNGQDIAIKRVTKVFEKTLLAKRALREIKLLRHFNGHDNITAILDIEVGDISDFSEVFLVQELMEADLHQIIRSEQPLTDAHFQYFIYQVLRGLKYIHSANVLHRDLKPGNLLVNADCELKICDFGLARGFTDKPDSSGGFMTEYVATRWYRAPEIMLSFQSYTKAIDVWSVGCIFGELLSGKPLFRGHDYVDQLNQILAVLGTPDDATIKRIGSQRAQVYIKSLPRSARVPFSKSMPKATPLAIDLLERLLQFDPATRYDVNQALAHPYLATYHEPSEEPSHTSSLDFSFEEAKSIEEIRSLITNEVKSWKIDAAKSASSTDDASAKAASTNASSAAATTTTAGASSTAATTATANTTSGVAATSTSTSGTSAKTNPADSSTSQGGRPSDPAALKAEARRKSVLSPETIAKAREIPKAQEATVISEEHGPHSELEKELSRGVAVT